MIKPYYQENGITLYCGDSREILPQLSQLESIIVDPVWPDAAVKLPGSEDPYRLFAEMCQVIPNDTERFVVQLGCDSDPRFLAGIPREWPFLRVCWLDYARPSYKGRLLYTGDVAYAYGIPPAFVDGRQLISGKSTSSRADDSSGIRTKHRAKGIGRWTGRAEIDKLPHPTSRRLQHVEWLVHQFSDHAVCDPFMGSGTTGVAAKKLGRKFIGIEIVEEYCELAVKRIRRQQLARQEQLGIGG